MGSTNALTSSTGTILEQTSYDSFGNASNASFSSRYQFTGREFDSFTGLYFYRARWYDANIGRFISEDPIGFAGGDVNLFAYVRNNPVSFRDPLGLIDPIVYQDPSIYSGGKNFRELSCEAGNYNPWLGGEVGGTFHPGIVGVNLGGGVEINALTGQICFFAKGSFRIGLGLFAGAGLQANAEFGPSQKESGKELDLSLGVDLAVKAGGRVVLRGGKFINEALRKFGFGLSGSGSGLGIGVGPSVGLGGSIGLDVGEKSIFCINKPPDCPCTQQL